MFLSEIYNPRNERPEERVALSVGRNNHEVLETVSALQVRKEKDEELRANDAFWRTKLKELEARVRFTFRFSVSMTMQ